MTHADPVTAVQSDREQLTHLLRGLATRLDHVDRRLADLSWPECRSALETERERLSDRLAVLAALNDPTINARMGTCPSCGYPSLASGLCAFCQPHSVR